MLKCDTCLNMIAYILGADECGAGNSFEYCAKGHWEGYGDLEPEPGEEINHWDACKDFKCDHFVKNTDCTCVHCGICLHPACKKDESGFHIYE